VGGIGFFNTDIDHQPIPGNMSIFYISSMVDQPSTTQKNDNHKKSKTTKDFPFKKGHLPKKITPPSTPVLLHFQGRLAIHRDVLKQCFLPLKGHLQFRLHVLFLAGQDMSCKSWSKHQNLWARHGDQTSRLKEPQSVARAARPFHWLWAALLHLYLGM